MGNFYKDNDDIRFLFQHLDLAQLAGLCEEGYRFAEEFDYAPSDGDEAVQNYEMVLDALGELSADFIAPRAEGVDREGNTLNEDGTVTRAKGIAEALEKLAQAEVMGFTLPYRFGGLNFPNLLYSMATEIISRADASLMNIFGLQGIAETINAFACEEIKQEYLPPFAEGKVTGAMVLTEPDAGSDLQAVKLRAFEDEKGNWFLHGVKRFITNGCGDVLLVLSRSEPDRSGGLGLSLFVCEPGPTVHIRRLEDKLGIHGSPTCEIFFDNTPCKLIGERRRGLAPYVATLMNGARIGIAAQSMGIAEAAYRIARDYAASRKQFGMAIERLPAVRDMLIDMKIAVETGRALLYETSRVVDLAVAYNKRLEENPPEDKAELKSLKDDARSYKRCAGMLTPMAKYLCSEMCNQVAYDAIQVLGGSGYMRDYASERHARDARITTIYEGTSQLQIVAAVRGVCSGTAEKYIEDLAAKEYAPQVKDLLDKLAEGLGQLKAAVEFVKDKGNDYMDLYGRALTDVAIALINGYLLCDQASTKVQMDVAVAPGVSSTNGQTVPMKQRKTLLARRYVEKNAPTIKALTELICQGDRSTFSDYEALVGPVQEQ
ncbi:MAG: acyl-CoA dehydrogenase family protein [Sedimentisphaerales bacterium]|jgi:alkylation response protein AidB-like acyl-CoA dehydrogenase|nr:acyl-CoA dehydrogenase family protein [Sedimentisphaerales bacterium]HNY77451.1 acyl-CoA dehydrogenase family protein [Sedimentisphaerales bacterium]HOC62855.1 acyl-CoA dehydrogenase family protein [Sedimentisphaerales bacterium]HOH63659.1 acyl-CoA dehydrogenase family protein [Sedimentisphaerales bacterium]HPY51508.1 acyl-CoA dehydrogenase family protein [Sedimentisphaerales bacterium]